MEWLTQVDWCGLTGFGICVIVPVSLFFAEALGSVGVAWARRRKNVPTDEDY